MFHLKTWLQALISSLLWLVIILLIVLFSTDAFSQFIYTNF